MSPAMKEFFRELYQTRQDRDGVPISWRVLEDGHIVTRYPTEDIRLDPLSFLYDQHTDPYIPAENLVKGEVLGLKPDEAESIADAAKGERWYWLRFIIKLLTIYRDGPLAALYARAFLL